MTLACETRTPFDQESRKAELVCMRHDARAFDELVDVTDGQGKLARDLLARDLAALHGAPEETACTCFHETMYPVACSRVRFVL